MLSYFVACYWHVCSCLGQFMFHVIRLSSSWKLMATSCHEWTINGNLIAINRFMAIELPFAVLFLLFPKNRKYRSSWADARLGLGIGVGLLYLKRNITFHCLHSLNWTEQSQDVHSKCFVLIPYASFQ